MTTYTNIDGLILGQSNPGINHILATSVNATLTGTLQDDVMRSIGGVDTFIGGMASNIYYVDSSSDQIIQSASAGIGTVYAASSYTLPNNVENLTLTVSNTFGDGNRLNNILQAQSTGQTLNGEGGNDVLVGGPGNDTYIQSVGMGSDVIYNFQTSDKIELSGYGITSFSQVQSEIKQVGADTLITLSSSQSLLLKGVTSSSLSSSNFELGLDMSHLKVSFSDNFTTLNQWQQKAGYWLNDESEIYVNSSYTGTTGATPLGLNPYTLTSNGLTITATPITSATLAAELDNQQYYSGTLVTKSSFSQEYGYFDVRAKLPSGQGFWPAFWLLPENGTWPPEIDVFEQLSGNPNTIYGSIHTDVTGTPTSTTNTIQVANATTQYHDYGVLWTASTISWYVDGVEVASEATPADMHQPMYMVLNLATGGSWGGAATGQTGQLQVSYVKAYALSDAPVTGNSLPGAGAADNGPVSTTSTTSTSSKSSTSSAPATVTASAPVYTAPVAKADTLTESYGAPLALASSTLLAGDTVSSGLSLTISNVSAATHGTVSLASGKVTFTPFEGYDGQASFSYTVSDGAGGASNAAVTVNINGAAPSYINDSGSASAHTVDFTGDTAHHDYVAGSGQTTIYTGAGGSSLNLGSGADTVIGGRGKDFVTLGSGVDTVTGGVAGLDTFVFLKGQIENPNAHGGQFDVITDFNGTNAATAATHDVLEFSGFSKTASLIYLGDSSTNAAMHIYELVDGSYTAEFVLEYAGHGGQLSPSLYSFI
jgi:beta-glucanase (GH16 family)